jgi:hypothetical protein
MQNKRVNTRVVVDLAGFFERGTWKIEERDGFEYSGRWALAKGDKDLKAGEQQQLDFNKQLMQVFQQQYGKQAAQLDYLNSILKPIIADGGRGLSPEALTSMRTSASDSIAREGQNAKAAVAATEAARGGGTGLPSGVEAQLDEGVALNEANQQSSAQNQITQYNENVRQANFWNAINGLSGNAAMLNPQSYAGEANSGSSSLANLGTAYYNSQQSGWLNAALGGLGAAAGGWASGGFKMPGGCWIAEAIYGPQDLRTHLVREWLNTTFVLRPAGRVVMQFYMRFGQRIASVVSRSRALKAVLRPLFDRALSEAITKLN